MRKAGLSFPVVLGGDLGKGSVFEKYRVTDEFPAAYLVDSHGRIVYRTAGQDIAGLRRALTSIGIQWMAWGLRTSNGDGLANQESTGSDAFNEGSPRC